MTDDQQTPRPSQDRLRELAEAQPRWIGRDWPWPSIPPLYREIGLPSDRILGAVLPAMGREPERLPVLTITGAAGCGKTTIAAQIAAWIAYREDWHGTTGVGYQIALRLGWLDPEAIDEMAGGGAGVLILDDLGGALTKAALTKALEILERRTSWGRRTIVTTTLDLPAIAALEVQECGREIGVASRLAGGVVIRLGSEDRRTIQRRTWMA